MSDFFKTYAGQATKLASHSTTIESTYYPALVELLSNVLRDRKLPFQVRGTTSERRASGGRDQPDIALYDGIGDFLVVCTEVKGPSADLEDIAFSTDRNDQIGRYLAQTGVVLISNVRSFGLLTAAPGALRDSAIPPSLRRLERTAELWPSAIALKRADQMLLNGPAEVGDLIELAVTRYAPIAEPESLARILARQARRAKQQLPSRFTESVQGLLEDFGTALGITFEGEEGEEFFRSSLIQTVYYGLFAGWLLWLQNRNSAVSSKFTWDRVPEYLRIPFIGELFHELQHPTRIRELGLREHLDLATEALSRVDQSAFQNRLTVSSFTLEKVSTPASYAAIMYFYEPFLEAFDPDLRKELGVWYTPPEIVRYQVQRVDALLRNELSCPRGLADENVIVLDPCCGTGAYLVESLRIVAQQLRSEGVGALLGDHLLEAVRKRILGFEILTAPFVIAHLQMYLLLSSVGAQPEHGQRSAIFLTNALTGWKAAEQIRLHFPELQVEHDAARSIKTTARIIVVIGNPPYNRFAGVPMKEEADLVDQYKGIHRDARGRQIGQTDLFSVWGVRKHLLDDLYIRFFRLAEECIGERADYGVVSFISNNSYLNGRSHPIMRESLLSNFDTIWIDNLHGNRLASERTPSGESCETIFSIAGVGAGIKVGTAISTLVKKRIPRIPHQKAAVLNRDFWGRAATKRAALLESLPSGQSPTATSPPNVPVPPYESIVLNRDSGWKLARTTGSAGYEDWIGLDELFPIAIQGVNPNRGLSDSIIDFDSGTLAERMRSYFSDAAFDEFQRAHPILCEPRARYDPEAVRARLQDIGYRDQKIVSYLLFPLDARWIYYETTGKLLNEARSQLWDSLPGNEFLIAVPQPRRYSETRPLISKTAFDLHVHDRGAVGFPADIVDTSTLFAQHGPDSVRRRANLPDALMQKLNAVWAAESIDARELVRRLQKYCLAICHSPQYETDNKDGLAQDWARIALPRLHSVFQDIVEAGSVVAQLLDPTASAENAIQRTLGPDATPLGRVEAVQGGNVRETELVVSYSYYGAAKGRWERRAYTVQETAHEEWGEYTGDLFLNERIWVRNVPEKIWKYEIGGYPVLKKWLGYRDEKRRPNTTLNLSEINHFRSMVKRIASLLILHNRLDRLYETCLGDCMGREELLGVI